MGCGASVPAWEAEATSLWQPLTMRTKWQQPDKKSNSQRLLLTVLDSSNSSLMTLIGGSQLFGTNGRGSTPLALDALISAGSGGTTFKAERTHLQNGKTKWCLDAYTRSVYRGSRKAKWSSSAEADGSEGALPTVISLNCSGGRVRAWRGEAPDDAIESTAAANKKRRDDLLGFVSANPRIPKDADMGSYGFVKEAELGVDAKLVRDASKEELALFLAILTDFFWSPPPGDILGEVPVHASDKFGAAM